MTPIFLDGLAPCVNGLLKSIRNPGRGCGSVWCLFCQSALEQVRLTATRVI